MKIKLKETHLDNLIYLSLENRWVMGRFLENKYFPYMYSKYPQLFEEDIEEIIEDDFEEEDLKPYKTKKK